MSSIFKTRNNIGVTDNEIGRVMFAQIIEDAIEEAQKGDRILIAYTMYENDMREVIRQEDNKYFVNIDYIGEGDHQIHLNTFNITIRFINVGLCIDTEDVINKIKGYTRYDKVIVVDASLVTKHTLTELSHFCHSPNGRDREAVTFITSGTGYKNDEVNEMIKDPSSARWGIPIHVFDYKERSVR